MRETDLLEENERLREEVRYWRGEAEAQADAGAVVALQVRFGLTAAEAYIVGALHRQRPDRYVQTVRLVDDVPTVADGRDTNCINVLVSRIRRKMGRDAVLTIRGGYGHGTGGYQLGAAARVQIDEMKGE